MLDTVLRRCRSSPPLPRLLPPTKCTPSPPSPYLHDTLASLSPTCHSPFTLSMTLTFHVLITDRIQSKDYSCICCFAVFYLLLADAVKRPKDTTSMNHTALFALSPPVSVGRGRPRLTVV
ncbi:hypothetical protein BD310DRAFT_147250 [Dichomitus squalens]|uniref:Uncharacterized protein n=1 Tax=Dichomitus squalens TaxID=114155 RepID=A0A4Q9Q5C2_9APHY|nr:hypothetical protein BD310DRAFT_147250 [Dichomitus squalens]